jgi:hypothetical protein
MALNTINLIHSHENKIKSYFSAIYLFYKSDSNQDMSSCFWLDVGCCTNYTRLNIDVSEKLVVLNFNIFGNPSKNFALQISILKEWYI